MIQLRKRKSYLAPLVINWLVISLAAALKSIFTEAMPSSLPFVPDTTTGTEDLLIKSLISSEIVPPKNIIV